MPIIHLPFRCYYITPSADDQMNRLMCSDIFYKYVLLDHFPEKLQCTETHKRTEFVTEPVNSINIPTTKMIYYYYY